MNNSTLKSIKDKVFEYHSVSKDVDTIVPYLVDQMCTELTKTKWGNTGNQNVKHIEFGYKLFGTVYKISVDYINYGSVYDCLSARKVNVFRSYIDTQNRQIEFRLGCVKGIPYEPVFDDIIHHEIQHLYKESLGAGIKDDLKDSVYTNEFYNKMVSIYNDRSIGDDKIKKIAYALYSSFEYEMNGFVGGLDGIFKTAQYIDTTDRDGLKKAEDFKRDVLLNSQCFKVYENLVEVLGFIDDINDYYLYSYIGLHKVKIRNVLQKAKDRYLKIMSKLIYDNSKLWDGDRSLINKVHEGHYGDRVYGVYWLV